MNIGMTITGAKEMERMFERLEKKETAKIVRHELTNAQKIIMRPAVGGKAIGMVGGEMGTLLAKNLFVQAMKKMRRGSYGRKLSLKATDAFVYETADKTRYYIPAAIEYGHAFPGSGRGGYMAMGMSASRAA